MSIHENRGRTLSFVEVFGLEAEKPKVRDPEAQIALIERGVFRHLELGNLFIFDADTCDDQCHINGLRVAEIFRRFKKNPTGLSVKDKRFLILSFLVSILFRKTEKNTFNKHLISALDVKLTKKPRGKLIEFVNWSEQPARRLLNGEVRRFIDQKLQFMGREELIRVLASSNLGKTPHGYFRFPKFPGLLLMVEEARREGFSFVFRIRLLCGKGLHTVVFTRSDSDEIKDQPVFVVEGVALNNGQSFAQYRDFREKLPGPFGTGEKPPPEACPDGEKCSVVREHREAFTSVLEDEDKLLLSEGSDFSFVLQRMDVDLFCSLGLQESFDFHLNAARQLGLTGMNPRLLTIEHMICDIGKKALEKTRYVDTPAASLIEQRRSP